MATVIKAIGSFLIVLLFIGCEATPRIKKPYIDQIVWAATTKDKAYGATLTALTMEGIGVHPIGTNKEAGLIVSKPIDFYLHGGTWARCYYTLQIIVSETQDGKVMITIAAVDTGIRSTDGSSVRGWENDARREISKSVADDTEKIYVQLDKLLGKAEYYKQDKVLYEKDF